MRDFSVKKVVYVVPILAPYAIERFRVLAREPELDVHIIAEKAKTDARQGSGWDFQQIEGCRLLRQQRSVGTGVVRQRGDLHTAHVLSSSFSPAR